MFSHSPRAALSGAALHIDPHRTFALRTHPPNVSTPFESRWPRERPISPGRCIPRSPATRGRLGVVLNRSTRRSAAGPYRSEPGITKNESMLNEPPSWRLATF